MVKQYRELTNSNIDLSTMIAASVVKRAQNLVNDPDKKQRLKEHYCVACYYSDQIGGCAMTEDSCGICGFTQVYGSTNTGRICNSCAEAYKLCVHCGGKISSKERGGFSLEFKTLSLGAEFAQALSEIPESSMCSQQVRVYLKNNSVHIMKVANGTDLIIPKHWSITTEDIQEITA